MQLVFDIQVYYTDFYPLFSDVPPPTNASVLLVPVKEAGKVKVTWNKPVLKPSQVITGYSVQYRKFQNGSFPYTTRSASGSSTTSYTITNLTLGTVYEVRVASVGLLGLSGYCCGNGKHTATYDSECAVQGEIFKFCYKIRIA